MIGNDSRGRARARARTTVHENAMHGWGRLARARARATVHKNAMIEDDARAGARARGRHDAQEFPKSQNREIHDFQKRINVFGRILG